MDFKNLKNIQIIKSHRKSFSIIIDKKSAVITVRMPVYATKKDIEFVLNKKKSWIEKNLETINYRLSTFKPKSFTENEEFSIVGKAYNLKYIDDNFMGIRMDGNNLIIHRRLEKHAKQLITEVYRNATIRYVKNYIGPFLIHLKNENKLSFPDISNIRISNARTKWGSCSSKRVLSFSWRIGMAPVEVINYIICHEMAHLVHLNHSDKFWALVKMIMPDYLEAEKWLKANGHTLDL